MRSHDYITQIQLLLTYLITDVRSPNEIAHPRRLEKSAIGNYMVWFADRVANDTGKSTDQD